MYRTLKKYQQREKFIIYNNSLLQNIMQWDLTFKKYQLQGKFIFQQVIAKQKNFPIFNKNGLFMKKKSCPVKKNIYTHLN